MNKKLDIEEGRRLLAAMTQVQGVAEHHEEFDGWLWDNAEALLDAAAKEDRLRELLAEARAMIERLVAAFGEGPM